MWISIHEHSNQQFSSGYGNLGYDYGYNSIDLGYRNYAEATSSQSSLRKRSAKLPEPFPGSTVITPIKVVKNKIKNKKKLQALKKKKLKALKKKKLKAFKKKKLKVLKKKKLGTITASTSALAGSRLSSGNPIPGIGSTIPLVSDLNCLLKPVDLVFQEFTYQIITITRITLKYDLKTILSLLRLIGQFKVVHHLRDH